MNFSNRINNDELWNEFLEYKINSSHLPDKIIENYKDFVQNKEYKKVTECISKGTYKFTIPKKVLIGKMGKSKKRTVYIYNKEETYILKMVAYILYNYDYLFYPNLYSFRKNSGVKKAIYDITKKNKLKNLYGYKVDIQNYFNSIPVEQLLEELESDIDDKELFEFIKNILLNNKVQLNGSIIEEPKGIMAGVPISSFLANYYLRELDEYFYKNNIIYARYADDVIVFADNIELLKLYQRVIKTFLSKKGLLVNKDKEFFYNPGEKFEFLGFSYCDGIIDISGNSFKKIKGKIRRTARGLRRWAIKKNASYEVTLKAMNRKFNRKFFGKNENDLTWKYWFFPTINTTTTLKNIDSYMQDWQRYIVTGVHNKRNFEKVPFTMLKQCNYKSLVNEYYNSKK